jgi:hypothetical protein
MNSAVVKSSFIILPNGRCSNCDAMVKVEEDGWTIVKNRLLKINSEERIAEIKCPGCKEFLKLTIIQ